MLHSRISKMTERGTAPERPATKCGIALRDFRVSIASWNGPDYSVVVQRVGQVKWKGKSSVLPFDGQLGQTSDTTVVGRLVGCVRHGRTHATYGEKRPVFASGENADTSFL